MSITKLAPWQSAGPTLANIGPDGGRRVITGLLTAGADLSKLLPNRQPNQLHPPPPAVRPFDDKL